MSHVGDPGGPDEAESKGTMHTAKVVARAGYSLIRVGCCMGVALSALSVDLGAQNWIRRAPAVSPAARIGHAMAYDSQRGSTVLVGDGGAGASFAGTWGWDGSNWPPRPSATSPSAGS